MTVERFNKCPGLGKERCVMLFVLIKTKQKKTTTKKTTPEYNTNPIL